MVKDTSNKKSRRSKKAKLQLTDYGNKMLKINPPASFGWIGRYFDDGGHNCLYEAWSRLRCIDEKGREWGQPYYALNPEKGEQKSL